MYCRCGPKFDFATATRAPAPANWQAKEAYVCSRCNRISHAVQEAVDVVRGPENARALLHSESMLDGRHIDTWAVGPQDGKERSRVQTVNFYPWPRRNPMSDTEPLIYLSWKHLMGKVAIIMSDPEATKHLVTNGEMEEGIRRAKYEARGIAEILAIQMKPFMESADQVVRCAVKKYKDPSFEVPGLGEHLWDPLRNPDGSQRTPVTGPKSASKPAAKPRPRVDNKSTKKLTKEEAEGIKNAVESGMFSKEDVASMFKVSIDTVNAALSS